MSRGSRGALRVPPGDDDLDDVSPVPEGEAQITLDPAEIAADLMIDRTLAATASVRPWRHLATPCTKCPGLG